MLVALPINTLLAETIDNEMITTKLGTSPFFNEPCYFDDDYFNDSPSTYNPSLATVSLFASLSPKYDIYYIPDEYVKVFRAEEFLTSLGFEDIQWNEDCKDVGEDTLGIVCAQKEIKIQTGDYTLVSVIVRGYDCKAEMASNLTIGESSDSQGYDEASQKLYSYVDKYLKNNVEFGKKIKLWLTGYYRGGAAVNLAARNIMDIGNIGGRVFSKDNLYAYTFDCPLVSICDSTKAQSYKNIHNIVNNNNLLTHLSPANWGFVRYGVNENVVPTQKTATNASKYQAVANIIGRFSTNYTYYDNASGTRKLIEEQWQAKDINITWKSINNVAIWNTGWKFADAKFYEAQLIKNIDYSLNSTVVDSVNIITKALVSRGNYKQSFQNALRILFASLDGYEGPQLYRALSLFETKLKENYATLTFFEAIKDSYRYNKLFTKIVNDSLNESGIRSEEYTQLCSAIFTIMPVINHTLWAALAQGCTDTITTFIYNFDIIERNINNPYIILAWLEINDPNYNQPSTEANTLINEVIEEVDEEVDEELIDEELTDEVIVVLEETEEETVEEQEIIVKDPIEEKIPEVVVQEEPQDEPSETDDTNRGIEKAWNEVEKFHDEKIVTGTKNAINTIKGWFKK